MIHISTCHTKRDSLKSVKIKVGKRFIVVKEERGIRHDDTIYDCVKDQARY